MFHAYKITIVKSQHTQIVGILRLVTFKFKYLSNLLQQRKYTLILNLNYLFKSKSTFFP